MPVVKTELYNLTINKGCRRSVEFKQGNMARPDNYLKF